MTMLVNLIRYVVIGGIIPYFLGIKITRGVEKGDARPMQNVLNGYIVMWALIQLLAVPMIYCKVSFHVFVRVCLFIFCIFSAWNVVSERHYLCIKWKNGRRWIKEQGMFRVMLWCIMVLQAIYVALSFLSNDDDAFYVASAQTALDTDTMYRIDPYTGDMFCNFPARYVLSPFPLFVAFMGRVVGLNAPTMAHTLLPVILILLIYVVYEIWARFLFQDNKQAQTIFLFFVMVVLAFCNYTTHARGMMMFPRIWQGKAVLATILLPLILVLGMRMVSYGYSRMEWLYLFLVMMASCFVSSMGIMLSAIEIGICGLLTALRRRQVKPLAYTVLCCMPNLIYGIIYLLIR